MTQLSSNHTPHRGRVFPERQLSPEEKARFNLYWDLHKITRCKGNSCRRRLSYGTLREPAGYCPKKENHGFGYYFCK